MDVLRWFYPGLKVKRWILVVLLGALLSFFGIVVLLGPSKVALLGKQSFVTLGEILGAYSRYNGIIFLIIGGFTCWYGFKKTMHSVMTAAVPQEEEKLVKLLNRRRQQKMGPKIVALGGGTGLPNLLRGLKPYTQNITAVVTVSDDGGSSGKLRGEFGMVPPGDVRNCLLALADTEPLMEEIFNYRFKTEGDLEGHNVGNLIIAALNDKKGFKDALASVSRVLAVKGNVLPVTDQSLTLKARCTDGTTVVGESSISNQSKQIEQVYLDEQDVSPLSEVITALEEADAIILGPGSLYTSVIPNLLVPGIPEAIKNSQAVKIYVSNIMTQPGETDNYRASDHLRSIIQHTEYNLVDTVLINGELDVDSQTLAKYKEELQEPVQPDIENLTNMKVDTIIKNFNGRNSLIRHDSELLGEVIIKEVINKKKEVIRKKLFARRD
ncbi:uridine diphosphate-N-acetylglucosamine-binding protein YvcK [Natranaerobius thermophilus]|uniref:Putative gluconeogenesis factor n=1 Tax=Natranaerobius thermophilus (strain ATCC BAA-1301 / DSM 18059 / JW/NM-WN-LF) TaxID=457570 RepID=B2A6Z9_NATTJ|nr:uridine diphosphate-N-acetylglucosamine-binding protein YvcK [Natranaerobius thermophilus]ACB85590.1 protein of unknown function UPF0052 and CofD [Natranaerobius thermophilus JW/NM-WN-LF]